MKRRLKHLFIPYKGNRYRPDFLERVSMGIMVVLVVLSFALANLQSLLWINSEWMVSTILPSVIVNLTNKERGSESILPLRRNETLDRAAQLKAEDMAAHGYFAHYSPTGVSPWYWFDQVSYNFVHAGENLAVHFTDSDEVVEAWMDSPTHRANIMNGNYTEIGIGTAKGMYKDAPTIFVVQLFGTPAVSAASAQEIPLKKAPEPEPAEEPEVSEPAESTVVTASDTETTVMYSDLATTSRSGVPAIIAHAQAQEETLEVQNVLERSAIESGVWLRVLYAVLALTVLISLIISIAIEWRKHHLIQVAYASGLLALMAILLYVHTTLTGGVTII